MSPDPLAHGPIRDAGRDAIATLTTAALYARDRVIQGDWTFRHALQRLTDEAATAETFLRLHGCPDAKVYASISPSARPLVSYSYTWNGEAREGHSHPTGY